MRKQLAFEVSGQRFTFALTIPLRIRDVLRSEDWDVIVRDVKARAREYLWASGFAPVGQKVAQYLHERIYERFLEYQTKAGNSHWEVPPSLQEHNIHETGL